MYLNRTAKSRSNTKTLFFKGDHAMEKFSLQELEARSAICGHYPALLEIARSSKSPTTAYELSMAKCNGREDLAKACRYLSMIKRDFGEMLFDNFVQEIEGKSRKEGVLLNLKPFEQTIQRFHYLLELGNSLGKEFSERFSFSEMDEPYLLVVEQLVAGIDGLQGDHARIFHDNMVANSQPCYIDEARRFATDARNRKCVDRYGLEKTMVVLGMFISFVADLNGIPRSDLCLRDHINQNYWSRPKKTN